MTDGKMVVLKPVVWNDQGYRWPSGKIATSGYTRDHGYGHEEWNGRADWTWEGWRVFHTEAKGAMHRYAEGGRLGIIMTAMHDGKFFAVGAGCNVYENSDKDAAAIAKALRLHDYTTRMWQVESIRKAMGSRQALNRHWLGHTNVNWRCPMTHYAWFEEPIEVVPNELIPSTPPRQAIAKMHGSYQALRADQALSIVRQVLPENHSIVGWLSTDDFDEVSNRKVRSAPKPTGGAKGSASTPNDPFKRYMQECEVVVTPLHARLQDDFVNHIQKKSFSGIRENLECVDVRYIDPKRGSVLVEVKPTDPATVRFAVRIAMGQLLDYEQRASGSHSKLIVIDNEPCDEDKELANSNQFGVSWRSGQSFNFAWPGE